MVYFKIHKASPDSRKKLSHRISKVFNVKVFLILAMLFMLGRVLFGFIAGPASEAQLEQQTQPYYIASVKNDSIGSQQKKLLAKRPALHLSCKTSAISASTNRVFLSAESLLLTAQLELKLLHLLSSLLN